LFCNAVHKNLRLFDASTCFVREERENLEIWGSWGGAVRGASGPIPLV
jgi:hypothetical protein